MPQNFPENATTIIIEETNNFKYRQLDNLPYLLKCLIILNSKDLLDNKIYNLPLTLEKIYLFGDFNNEQKQIMINNIKLPFGCDIIFFNDCYTSPSTLFKEIKIQINDQNKQYFIKKNVYTTYLDNKYIDYNSCKNTKTGEFVIKTYSQCI